MTKEEKQLLLTDLCARLPYGVMCKIQTCFVFEDGTLRRGSHDEILDLDTVTDINEWKESGEIEKFKPYLHPMSSMTEEEKGELRQWGCLCMNLDDSVQDIGVYGAIHSIPVIDWLNAHHFDYRGLIEKGLALEAPKGMYEIVPSSI